MNDIRLAKEDISRLVEGAVIKIKRLPITETAKHLRLANLEYLVEKLRKARYEEDGEEAEERFLSLIGKIASEDSSAGTDFNMENEAYARQEEENLRWTIEKYSAKVEESFKIAKAEKQSIVAKIEAIRDFALPLLRQFKFKEYNF